MKVKPKLDTAIKDAFTIYSSKFLNRSLHALVKTLKDKKFSFTRQV